MLFLLIISGCAPSASEGLQGVSARDGPREGKLTRNFLLEELREIAAETNEGEIKEPELSGIRAVNNDFKDVNTTPLLFAENLRDEDARFNRLEGAVQDIHSDLSEMKPSLKRLIAIEGDIKELHKQLSRMVASDELPTIEPSSTQNTQPQTEPRRLSLSSGRSQPVMVEPEPDPLPLPNTPKVVEEITEPFLPSLNLQPQLEAETVIASNRMETAELSENIKSPMSYIQSELSVRAWDSGDKTRVVFEYDEAIDFDLQVSSDLTTLSFDIGKASLQVDNINDLPRLSDQITNALLENSKITLTLRDTTSVSEGFVLPAKTSNTQNRYYFDLIR
jgi:hypothetical protein